MCELHGSPAQSLPCVSHSWTMPVATCHAHAHACHACGLPCAMQNSTGDACGLCEAFTWTILCPTHMGLTPVGREWVGSLVSLVRMWVRLPSDWIKAPNPTYRSVPRLVGELLIVGLALWSLLLELVVGVSRTALLWRSGWLVSS